MKYVCGLLLLLMYGTLPAQEYSFRAFGNNEGLSNLAVKQIYQDRAGFLWVSTENGIFRYDGERFEAFGPTQGIPTAAAAGFGEAPDGSLLVGGEFGLYRLSANRFERVALQAKTISWHQGIKADGKGHTFLGTDAGLIELSSQGGDKHYAARMFAPPSGTSEPAAYGIFVDGDIIWYGCGHEVCRWDQNEKDRDGATVFGRGSGIPDRACLAIGKDSDGTIWVRMKNEGVFILPLGELHFRRPAAPIAAGSMGMPLIDSDGRALLPTASGLLIHDKGGWQKIDRASGLRGDVYAVFEDRQHSLWIGLAGQGLVQWRGYQEWESYSTASGLASDVVYEILPEDGALWVGTEGGLLHGEHTRSGIRWSKVHGLDGLPVHAVRRSPNGDLWAGTELRGIARVDVRTQRVQWFGETQGLLGKAAYTLRFDSQQRLWVATDAGLFLATAPYMRFSRVHQLPSSRMWAIAEGSDGTVWAGGADGLFALADGEWRSFKRSDGLSNQEILSLGPGGNGSMWIGYRHGGGIDRVRLERRTLAIEKAVQRPGTDGLVYFIEPDSAGRLWVGTEHGVDLWDGAHWSHYDAGDGLAWSDCNLNAFAAQPDGTVWIGTSGGLSRFKPHPRSSSGSPPQVVFTKLLIGQTDVSGRKALPAGNLANSLLVRYSALGVRRPDAVIFRYRLKGANSDWTETTQRELQFAELAPGAYKLQVEAQQGDGEWSGQRAEFGWTVRAPWYLSPWCYAVYVLIPVLAAWGVVRWRTLQLQGRERELQQLIDAQEEIRNLAFYDTLTGLPNRRMLLEKLSRSPDEEVRSDHLRALLFVDLDNFKMLNDTLGHSTGDLLLQEVARRLRSCAREEDTTSRLGGDEFVVMIEDLSKVREEAATRAESVAERILAELAQPYLLAGREWRSSCSIGITVFEDRVDNSSEALKQADIAMYQAKESGRNQIRFFAPELQAAVTARAAMEESLRKVIESDQFLLYYQPQVERGLVIGGEALVRWQHPEKGLLAPGEFIALAEQTGLILSLGNWVLEAACRQLATWASRSEAAPITIAVNISARQFHEADFVERVVRVLESTGASAKTLKLELTESMLVEGIEDVIFKMTQLKLLGVQLSLDDFGTGYSSLSYLRQLPLNQLKIDRSFVCDLADDPRGGAIAQTIISLGRAMGMSVLAEGVETKEQLSVLAALGCHTYQGYLFSRPLPAADFERLIPPKRCASQALF